MTGLPATGEAGFALGYARVAALAGAFALSVHALTGVAGLGLVDDYTVPFLSWLGSCCLYAAAVSRPRGMRIGIAAPGRVAALALAIVLLAAVVRLWNLDGIPYVFQGDESAFGLWARGLSLAPLSNPFSSGFMSQPTLGLLYETVSFSLLGDTVTAARLPWTLLGIASVPVACAVATTVAGPRVGLMTAAMVATYHFHIHYSRTALNNIADPLFLGAALLFLILAVEHRRIELWAAFGAACGLALFLYQGARLTPVVGLAVLAYIVVTEDRETRRGMAAGALAALGAFLVTAAPMLQFAVLHPDDFNARINQISIFAPGWLAGEAKATGSSVLAILWSQFQHAALAFNLYPDTSHHYWLDRPLLDWFFGAVFLVGLVWSTVRVLVFRAEWRLAAMVAWWWGGTVIGGALTLTPPASQRLVTLTVPVCFFIALAVDRVATRLSGRFAMAPAIAAVAASVLFAAISLKTYFLDYAPQHRNGGRSSAVAMEIAAFVNREGADADVYFAGAPHMYWGFPTLPFLHPSVDARDILVPLTEPPSTGLPGKHRKAAFIFLPARAAEIDLVEQAFPGGRRFAILNPAGAGEVLATAYLVER